MRYQLNPANSTTVVQAALAGDVPADFTITLVGLVSLSAANFALTPSQSSADLAAGAALTFSKVHDSGRRAGGIRIFKRSGQSLYIVPIVLRLHVQPCGG